VMRDAVFEIGSRYVREGTAIVDLGCSRGDSLARLVDRFGAHNRFVGVEVAGPMRDACRERFRGLIQCGVVSIRDLDLRESYPPDAASLTQAVLTLQFTPIEYRQQIVARAYERTLPGGAMVVVEKVLGESAGLDALMVETYLGLKRRNGYSPDDIRRKQLALEGILVPLTARWNEELLRRAGFRQIDCFWRWMNFAAWVAVRD
jgi:tRNA (cmo5U34)-methyltransferase